MKYKFKAFDKFTLYKIFVKKQISLKIKILRFDYGCECKSNEFKDLCKKERIK